MPEYQFGREVTVKLPEPREIPKTDWIAWDGTDIHVEMSKNRPHFFDIQKELRRSNLREYALILLAAADYAERGDDGGP